MIYYILTVIIGVALDFWGGYSKSTILMRKCFVLWLYVFLCFGYMTGSDWRTYEMQYMYMNSISDLGWLNEMGFNFVFFSLKKILSDFWLVVGVLKCLYLYTLLRVAKLITPHWLAVISLMITGDLSFMLIDNPLRFMTALVLVNLALELCLKNKIALALLLVFLSFFMHNTSIFYLLLIPCVLFAERIARWNKVLLAILYVLFLYVGSSVQILEYMRQSMISFLITLSEDVRAYSAYEITSNASFFSLGNMFGVMMFLIILLTRDIIIWKHENGKMVYSMAIINAMLSKLLIIIPTGFRLAIPFSIFYIVYMVFLLRSTSLLKWFFVAYISISFPLNLWTTYKYIPYSNSIPYILTGHIDYNTRSRYNINAYEKRTGKTYNGDF